jgi:hypothetical protein
VTHRLPHLSAPAHPFGVISAAFVGADAITTLLAGEIMGAPGVSLVWAVKVNGARATDVPVGARPLPCPHGVVVVAPTMGDPLLFGVRL